jgi:hypothetical protein
MPALGAGIGAGLALVAQHPRWSLMGSPGVERVELILLIMWAGDRLYPYIPVANPHSAREIVAPLLLPVLSEPLGLARAAVRWLVVAYLAETLGGWRWAQFFALFVFGEFAGRVLIAGHALSQPDMLGAVVAFVLWLVLRHVVLGRLLLAVAFAALVVVVRLAPFDFVGLPHGFGWLPFQSLMTGSTGQLVRGIFSDAFLYGGLIWLLTRLRLSFAFATALTVTLLLLIAAAQSWTSGPAGEITDAVVAALIGSVLFLLGGDETAEGSDRSDAPDRRGPQYRQTVAKAARRRGRGHAGEVAAREYGGERGRDGGACWAWGVGEQVGALACQVVQDRSERGRVRG